MQESEARSVPVNRAARWRINPIKKRWVCRHHERHRVGRASGSIDPGLAGCP
ncbi:fumarylacetoacetate hydrolase [Xanthomonas citri pv. citri]|nr:fumarylacetoacetate hydrolase [Xanthomonas citri pv. citri]APR15030.1 fumarylacetoacetate hydrolase [Xanthomonas citri pv. citri]APR21578.1 fumarylacetoacetate hydrolase [Xanthomonas citri pv. citri]APR26192.1 fumarylacetoacetate hydrolase [Xanthomonas citri pv. citri]OLR71415.1 fumarylacetoacetate hydrolase [Xanthomonas citri pv. citri]